MLKPGYLVINDEVLRTKSTRMEVRYMIFEYSKKHCSFHKLITNFTKVFIEGRRKEVDRRDREDDVDD